MDKEKINLSVSDVYEAIQKEIPIENSHITGKIDIRKLLPEDRVHDEINKDITFINCHIEALDADVLTFNKKFTLINCVIGEASFYDSFFLSGLTIDGCEFINDIFLMSAAGYNAKDKPIVIKNTIFRGYVDMIDVEFRGPLEISNCQFTMGTNLLGNKGKPYEATFDMEPVIINNKGRLDLDGGLPYWREIT